MITVYKPLKELIDLYHKSLESLAQVKLNNSIFMFETDVVIQKIYPKIYGQTFYCIVSDLEHTKKISLVVGVTYHDQLNVNDVIKVLGSFQLYQKKDSGEIYIRLVAESITKCEITNKNNIGKSLIEHIKTNPLKPKPFPLKRNINLYIIIPKSVEAKSTSDVMSKLQNPIYRELINITEVPCDMMNITEIIHAVKNAPNDIDVLAITRGGSSNNGVDISLFDNIELYDAISNLYVHRAIGIGHTNDRLLLEMATDYVAQTPSSLAEYIITQLDKNQKHYETIDECARISQLNIESNEKLAYLEAKIDENKTFDKPDNSIMLNLYRQEIEILKKQLQENTSRFSLNYQNKENLTGQINKDQSESEELKQSYSQLLEKIKHSQERSNQRIMALTLLSIILCIILYLKW